MEKLAAAAKLVIRTGLVGTRAPVQVGAILWPALVSPQAEYGAEVTWLTEECTAAMDKVQNQFGKTLLGCPVATPAECIRGDLGWMSPRARRALRALWWYGHLQAVALTHPERIVAQLSKLWRDRRVDPLLQAVGLRWEAGATEAAWKERAKEAVRRWETERGWRRLEGLRTTALYRTVRERADWARMDDLFQGLARGGAQRGVRILFGLRCGVAPLQETIGRRRGQAHERPLCPLCGTEREDAEHFLLRCAGVGEPRGRLLVRLRPNPEEPHGQANGPGYQETPRAGDRRAEGRAERDPADAQTEPDPARVAAARQLAHGPAVVASGGGGAGEPPPSGVPQISPRASVMDGERCAPGGTELEDNAAPEPANLLQPGTAGGTFPGRDDRPHGEWLRALLRGNRAGKEALLRFTIEAWDLRAKKLGWRNGGVWGFAPALAGG